MSDQLDVARAAHAGDLGAQCLGDLHCERADAAGGADHEDVLAGLQPPVVAQRLQCRHPGQWHGRRLLEGQAGGQAREELPSGTRASSAKAPNPRMNGLP